VTAQEIRDLMDKLGLAVPSPNLPRTVTKTCILERRKKPSNMLRALLYYQDA